LNIATVKPGAVMKQIESKDKIGTLFGVNHSWGKCVRALEQGIDPISNPTKQFCKGFSIFDGYGMSVVVQGSSCGIQSLGCGYPHRQTQLQSLAAFCAAQAYQQLILHTRSEPSLDDSSLMERGAVNAFRRHASYVWDFQGGNLLLDWP
jgi:hypothetical protein